MTKQVHTREMVAHLWAHKAQDGARVASGNFYFTGATLYSYGSHFVCAFHMPEEYACDGRAVALFNAGRYSMTTGRHMDAAWRALPGYVVRVDVPGLDENMTRGISRFGAGDVVAAMFGELRALADKAANPRIRPAARAGLFAQLRDVRADALHLARVDAARRDLSAERRKAARAQLAALKPEPPADGEDKAGAAAYAFAMNRAQWLEKLAGAAASAERLANRAIVEADAGNYGGALDCARDAERYAAGARELATKARARMPRSTSQALAAIKPGTEWRDSLESRARAAEVESARRNWLEAEAEARAALAERDFYRVGRILSGNGRRAFETLHGEPGDADRREFVAMLSGELSAWQVRGEADRARELEAAAREAYAAGKFTAAESAAYNAQNAMQRANSAPGVAFEDDAIAAVVALAKDAEARKPEEYAAQLVAWRNAEPGARFPDALHGCDRAAFLRLSADGRRVETSQGAEVPARVCALVWQLLGEVRAAGVARDFPRGAVQLGHFTLDGIDAAGNVRAGCHFIQFAELAGIAARLNFAPHN